MPQSFLRAQFIIMHTLAAAVYTPATVFSRTPQKPANRGTGFSRAAERRMGGGGDGRVRNSCGGVSGHSLIVLIFSPWFNMLKS